jgi:acyl-CoA dehydrogenase
MDFNYSKKSLELQEKLKQFFEDHIFPNEELYEKSIVDSGDPLHIPELLDELKQKAREEDLWNLFLPDSEFGAGLSNVEYAPLAEITGQSWWAPEVFNCSAPDTGNMEILAEFGTTEQKEEWLNPLLNGKIRSCFAMTEPDVASSQVPLLLMEKIILLTVENGGLQML